MSCDTLHHTVIDVYYSKRVLGELKSPAMVYIRCTLLAGGAGTKAEPLAPFLPIAIMVRQKQESRHPVPDELACQLYASSWRHSPRSLPPPLRSGLQGSYKAKWTRRARGCAAVRHRGQNCRGPGTSSEP